MPADASGEGDVGDVHAEVDVVVIGGGQAGLAAGFYLRRAGARFVILDDQSSPGGAWRHAWPSLRLFSPAEHSSLPGWQMPRAAAEYPDAAHVVDYLTRYEARYELPVRRPVRVLDVTRSEGRYQVSTDSGSWTARAVISATGTWSSPFVPRYAGQAEFTGTQVHSGRYAGPAPYRGRRVLVVGGANSGAQITAELTEPDHGVAEVIWVTQREVRYLPDDVDGRELFRVASAKVRGEPGATGVRGLGDVVVTAPVKAARDEGRLRPVRPFARFTARGVEWAEGSETEIDDVVWCTGFRPALGHLRGLVLPRGERGRYLVEGPLVPDAPGLALVGYGDWCGPASATLVGVGQFARYAVTRLVE